MPTMCYWVSNQHTEGEGLLDRNHSAASLVGHVEFVDGGR